MIEPLRVNNLERLTSPALYIDQARVRANLRQMVKTAGGVQRLRPHFKTHKTRELLRMEMELGITKHKCATPVEAEVLAQGGAASIFLAYPIVGPNVDRFMELMNRYETEFIALADAKEALVQLNETARRAGRKIEVAIDGEVGQRRTGAPITQIEALCADVARLPGLAFGGLHLYDGHNTAEPSAERRTIAERIHDQAGKLREALQRKGLPCPRIVFGGTPTFALHAAVDWPEVELSPGTCVLHDASYARKYPELGFTCAAQLLTRMVSRPAPNRLTFDLGTKALASDPPLAQRAVICGLENGTLVLHNEEHLTVETPGMVDLRLGQAVWAVPGHVCPTVALHEQALVVENGQLVGAWQIAARNRRLSWEMD